MRSRESERATVLVLVPAITLVLLCLGAIAIDLSLVHSVHRNVHRVASAAADDAAAMIDERELQLTGDVEVDAARAIRVARAHVAAAAESGSLAGDLADVQVVTTTHTVDVVLTVDAPHVFLSSMPGGDGVTRLVVSARGRLHR